MQFAHNGSNKGSIPFGLNTGRWPLLLTYCSLLIINSKTSAACDLFAVR